MLDKIISGRTDLVFDFLNSGHDPNSIDANGTPLISWCAYYGDVSAIKYLISKGVSINALGDNYDLNGAAFHGHWQLCQFLIEQGADVNHQLPDTGETPLHASLCKADRPVFNFIIKILLANGANPNIKTYPSKPTGGFMRDVFTKEETPLHRAAAFGNEEAISMLLEAGGDKTLKDMFGDTPLAWASWHLRPGKILSLLCYGNHSIHESRVRTMISDHGLGWGNGMEYNLLGNPQI